MEHGAKLAAYENFVPLVEHDYQNNLRTLSTD
jgi:hypothetical protein